LVIDKLPVLADLACLDKIARDFRLREGVSAETSGGILLVIAKEHAQNFIIEFKLINGMDCWIIGEVTEGENKAIIKEDAIIIEV